ncbi:maltokinase [Streptomyces corynorhini]|uniref:Maltokinase n=2 Tax=Streptomyces corynorhini TaxID=2282652 RepID=A0A370B6R0_9ACTN|nr:maltokinase [Streptomyces corynorhini]
MAGGGPGLLHLLVRVEQRGGSGPAPSIPPSATSSAPSALAPAAAGDCYQLLLGVRKALPPRLASALIGHATQGPLAGRTVYEGLHDPRLAEVLMERLRSPGGPGPLRFDRAGPIPAGLSGRLLDAEQSNTSLVYGNTAAGDTAAGNPAAGDTAAEDATAGGTPAGDTSAGGTAAGDAYILKILRRVYPGPHPDLELPLALAAEGCGRVPAPVGWFEAADPSGGGDTLTLGVLQPYLRGSRDGWQLALASLAGGREFTGEARALGRATAEVHTALAAALPTVTLGRRRTAQLAAGMVERLEATARAVPALLPYAPGLRTAFDAFAGLDEAGRGRPAQRVHGDLHLGQTLRTPDGRWSVIDFEGEPARPLAERRRPQPPVRDVAGMLRSFDYAARSHEPWRPDWATRCRDAYCEGYAAASGTDPRAEPELLRAYETDKAVYEVLYEARHRPGWLPVPMAAIRRLAGGA